MSDLVEKKCKPCEGGVASMNAGEIEEHLAKVDGWKYENGEIFRVFQFKNYYQTMAFVNAVAWIAHSENHHPDLVVGFKQCVVKYSTHAISGISENDFICAAKVDALLQ